MAIPTMMWIFIVGHIIMLIALGLLLWKMEVRADETIEERVENDEVM